MLRVGWKLEYVYIFVNEHNKLYHGVEALADDSKAVVDKPETAQQHQALEDLLYIKFSDTNLDHKMFLEWMYTLMAKVNSQPYPHSNPSVGLEYG